MQFLFYFPLRKHAYSNILKILPEKKRNFLDKTSDIFHISVQKHRLWVLVRIALAVLLSTHNLYFFSKNKKKIMYIPVNPSLTIKKWGLRGKNHIGMFS